MKMREMDYKDSPWVRRCFPHEVNRHETGVQTLSLYKSHFKKKIERLLGETHEVVVMDVARLTICYLLTSILCPTRSGTIPNHLMGFLEVFADIKDFDYADLVLEALIYQINQTTSMKLGGCAMLLLITLCERQSIIDPLANDAFPRFLRWDLTRLYTTLARHPIHELDASQVDDGARAYNAELLKFKVLLRHWETDGKMFLDSLL